MADICPAEHHERIKANVDDRTLSDANGPQRDENDVVLLMLYTCRTCHTTLAVVPPGSPLHDDV